MAKKRKFENHSLAVQAPSKKLCCDDRSRQPVAEGSVLQRAQGGSSESLPPLPPISANLSNAVFTHQSTVSNRDNVNHSASYERLEFLGDAYVEVMATRLVWAKFEGLAAGRLSQIRELLVKNETLSDIAVKYGLDKLIAAAPDVRTNSRHWTKVKGDLVEAYVAAIVLGNGEMDETGFAAAEKWLHQLWIPKLEGVLGEKAPNLNAKDALARKVVSRGVKLEYLEERPMKPLGGGQQTYFIGAFLTGWGYKKKRLGSGQGLNKTGAGNLAAENALQSPVTEQIAQEKMKNDEMTKYRGENRQVVDESAQPKENCQERASREREIVEKKRNLFLSTPPG